jgi:hypothetical protein
MFVSPDGDENTLFPKDWAPDVDGVASSQGTNGIEGVGNGFGFGVIVFENDHDDGPKRTSLQKTTVHEVGHIIGAGRADDGEIIHFIPEEVYSDSGDDDTRERVGFSGNQGDDWSVMSSGWSYTANNSPMSDDYIAFSIEELSTIEFEKLDSVNE